MTQTSYYVNTWDNMATLKYSTHPVFGNMLMILALLGQVPEVRTDFSIKHQW
jgi:hypothetical protein